MIDDEGLLDRAPSIGARLAAGLRGLVDGDRVTACRGDGAVWAIELAPPLSSVDVREELLTRGVIARPIGATTLAFCPPLVMSEAQVDRVVDATGASVGAAAR